MKKIISTKEYDKQLQKVIEYGDKQAVIDFMNNNTYMEINLISTSPSE